MHASSSARSWYPSASRDSKCKPCVTSPVEPLLLLRVLLRVLLLLLLHQGKRPLVGPSE